MNSKKAGTFDISRELLDEKLGKVAEVLSNMRFVPVRAEQLFMEGVVRYTGFSPLFAEADRGCVVPKYEIKIVDNEDGSLATVEVIKQ